MRPRRLLSGRATEGPPGRPRGPGREPLRRVRLPGRPRRGAPREGAVEVDQGAPETPVRVIVVGGSPDPTEGHAPLLPSHVGPLPVPRGLVQGSG